MDFSLHKNSKIINNDIKSIFIQQYKYKNNYNHNKLMGYCTIQ